ncbi:hypothetical protein [Desulforamulus reducens]|uniref:hypothetical protein n=1 Tax=Desulforamulus reducens TaxID=59610 RepID=UPI0003018D2B|nr:hypothetical protein [Desulforamulus reducens]
MLNNLQKHIDNISQEQIVQLNSFQEINIVSNNETIHHIKKLSKDSGLPVSRVIEALIRTALEDLQATAG